MNIGGSLAGNARFDAPTSNMSRLDSLTFSRVAVSMGEAAKLLLFEGIKGGCSFCMAGMALPDILTCLQISRKSFCVTGAILLQDLQHMSCIFRSRRSTLETSIVILRGRRSTLDVWCCVFFAIRIVRAASTGDNVQIAWQAWHLVTCDEN